MESSDSSPASDSLKMESSPTDSTPCSLWYPLWLIALLALFGSAAAGAYNCVRAFLADVSAFQVDSNNLLHVLYHKPVTGGTICCKLFNCPIQAILSIFWWLVHAASWIWDCCTYSDCGYSTIRISAAIEFWFTLNSLLLPEPHTTHTEFSTYSDCDSVWGSGSKLWTSQSHQHQHHTFDWTTHISIYVWKCSGITPAIQGW